MKQAPGCVEESTQQRQAKKAFPSACLDFLSVSSILYPLQQTRWQHHGSQPFFGVITSVDPSGDLTISPSCPNRIARSTETTIRCSHPSRRFGRQVNYRPNSPLTPSKRCLPALSRSHLLRCGFDWARYSILSRASKDELTSQYISRVSRTRAVDTGVVVVPPGDSWKKSRRSRACGGKFSARERKSRLGSRYSTRGGAKRARSPLKQISSNPHKERMIPNS